MKVWSWRQSIQKSPLQSTTKLVLLNLSIYMNELGHGCFPSTKTQASDTGLSERSICTHLDIAQENGFLIKSVHGYSGKGWKRHEYVASYPEGTELDSAPKDEGTEPDDIKALKEVQSNTPLNTPIYIPFIDWYSLYPRKRGKSDAEKTWKKLKVTEELFSKMKLALEQQKRDKSWKDKTYIPYASTYLNKRLWEDIEEVTEVNPITEKQKRTWTVTVNTVPFENDEQRDLSYTAWIESLFPSKE